MGRRFFAFHLGCRALPRHGDVSEGRAKWVGGALVRTGFSLTRSAIMGRQFPVDAKPRSGTSTYLDARSLWAAQRPVVRPLVARFIFRVSAFGRACARLPARSPATFPVFFCLVSPCNPLPSPNTSRFRPSCCPTANGPAARSPAPRFGAALTSAMATRPSPSP